MWLAPGKVRQQRERVEAVGHGGGSSLRLAQKPEPESSASTSPVRSAKAGSFSSR